MGDFDIGFLLFYVFVGVVLIPIAYMLDKRKEEVMIDKEEYDKWELERLEHKLEEYKTLLSAKQKANKLIKKLRKKGGKK